MIFKREKWFPYSCSLPAAFGVSVSVKEECTVFCVDCDDQCADVVFEGEIPVYMFADEGMRIASFSKVQKEYGHNCFKEYFLWEIEYSQLLRFMEKESCGISKVRKYRHFCIVTENDIVDVLASREPKITIIK